MNNQFITKVQFSFSKKATKILKNLPVYLMFTYEFQINWEILSNICCFIRKTEL